MFAINNNDKREKFLDKNSYPKRLADTLGLEFLEL